MLISHDAEYQIQNKQILKPTSATFQQGYVYGIVGHNGSGKSTFLKLLAKQLTPTKGSIAIEGKNLASFSHKKLARQLSYLPQYLPTHINLTAEELVKLGRFAWKGLISQYNQDDQTIIAESLQQTDTMQFKDRVLDSLSGGERQRVWLAMCLAQKSHYLLLDEPLSALDINHQIEVMKLLKSLAVTHNIGVIVVLHDINLASEFCDHILAFKQSQLVYNLPARDIINSAILQDIYEMTFTIVSHPTKNYPVALP